jgi:hypothetical protein
MKSGTCVLDGDWDLFIEYSCIHDQSSLSFLASISSLLFILQIKKKKENNF